MEFIDWSYGVAPALVAAAPYIASAVGAIGGALIGKKGGEDQARVSLQSAREQMKFQERMSNTAYQRAAADLEAAGLNRILALGSPASTPSGAGYSSPNIGASMVQGAVAGASTAKEISNIGLQRDLMATQSAQQVATAKAADASAANSIAQAELNAHNARAAKVKADYEEVTTGVKASALRKLENSQVSTSVSEALSDPEFYKDVARNAGEMVSSTARGIKQGVDSVKNLTKESWQDFKDYFFPVPPKKSEYPVINMKPKRKE